MPQKKANLPASRICALDMKIPEIPAASTRNLQIEFGIDDADSYVYFYFKYLY